MQYWQRWRPAQKATLVPDTIVTIARDPAYPPLTENAQIDALAARAQAIYAEIGKTIALSGNGAHPNPRWRWPRALPRSTGLGLWEAAFTPIMNGSI